MKLFIHEVRNRNLYIFNDIWSSLDKYCVDFEYNNLPRPSWLNATFDTERSACRNFSFRVLSIEVLSSVDFETERLSREWVRSARSGESESRIEMIELTFYS